MLRIVLPLLVFGALASWTGSARAGAETAEGFIRASAEKVFSSLSGELTAEERNRRFRHALNDSFDLKTIARFTLGRYWRTATDAQRAEYRRLFEEFLVRSYASRFRDLDRMKLRILRTEPITKRDRLVLSTLTDDRRQRPPLNIAWRVRKKGPELRIVDVVVEGISMSVTQRDEFQSVIHNRGRTLDGLLSALRARLRDE